RAMSDRVKFIGAMMAACIALLAMALTAIHVASAGGLAGHDEATCPVCVASREAGPAIAPSPSVLVLVALIIIEMLLLLEPQAACRSCAASGPKSVRGPPAAF
ncbi:MAG: hypothetical protein KDA48_16125, partial [Amphiplicatus sp.]|nr:hypothetical protein [Amphiplicatus sp.]